MRSPHRVFTIPAAVPFLPTLVEALFDGRLIEDFDPAGDPLALAGVTIYLPTRRAARAIREPLLHATGGAAILPRIRTLGDVDEEGTWGEVPLFPDDEFAAAPAIDDMSRQLILTRLILGWSGAVANAVEDAREMPLAMPLSPADSARLSRSLGELIDQVASNGGDWHELDTVDAGDLAGYWGLTLEFLKIVRVAWPEILAERGAIDSGARRDALIRAESARLSVDGTDGPVIAAGSTGSVPATAALLKIISALPDGAVVLPGLDLDADTAAWAAIGQRRGPNQDDASAGHPQFGLKSLLASLGIPRDEVVPLGSTPPSLRARAALVSTAMRPAESTDLWAGAPALEGGSAIDGLGLLEAENERVEGLAVALLLRESIEKPGTVAALITPDRNLARRVVAELRRWNIDVDDSSGTRLNDTAPGIFCALVAEVGFGPFSPHSLLALLKHTLIPDQVCGWDKETAVAAAERVLLRGPAPARGLRDLHVRLNRLRDLWRESVDHPPEAISGLSDADWAAAEALVGWLLDAFEPVLAITLDPARIGSLAGCVAAHTETMQRLASGDCEDDEALPALADFLDELRIACSDGPAIVPPAYPGLVAALAERRHVRRPGKDSRVHIWGALESRLQSADLVVLGGLNEASWPPETRLDPFLTRAMRAALALDPPERRIGLSAHDFCQALGHPTVWLSRSDFSDGTPRVPSRWLQRMEACLGSELTKQLKECGRPYLDLAAALDRPPGGLEPASRPQPKPALADRPRSLSVTRIETLIRDPYAVYARHVLKLRPFEPIGSTVGARERGTVVHKVLSTVVAAYPDGPFGAGALETLVAEGERAFAELGEDAAIAALWLPRFRRVAAWFAATEAAADPAITRHAEIGGILPFGDFRLTARADRLDVGADGALSVIDYKTGTPPGPREVEALLAPQLPLEALIASRGGFEGIGAAPIASLLYYHLSGIGPEPGSIVVRGGESRAAIEALTARAESALKDLIAFYAVPDNGYLSRRIPREARSFAGDYDHLARVAEWGLETPE